ncbi:hypothetical protein PLESTB_001897200 [Pleodorina starrii]|uniref:Protein-lysine methyltransferase METTL21D n=1 Tax=Pleodorina starrii TaxID=330485 RepID=A0A9W6C206_9CHLO|nr:hypothetical protein PLESTM_001945800 [Pleodorina starrii]GLC62417.1 hypothetical protein PLESTB_001897200 [Pleodorina starrii]
MDDGSSVREVELGKGALRIKEFTLLQDEAGAVVWDAGLVLSYYLAHQHSQGRSLVSGRTCLELGSGTGVVGLTAAKLGATHVYLSDLPHLVPYIRENIQLNGLGATCSALPLEWSNWQHLDMARSSVLRRPPEVILAADVVYSPEGRQSLFRTLAHAGVMAPPADHSSGPHLQGDATAGGPGRGGDGGRLEGGSSCCAPEAGAMGEQEDDGKGGVGRGNGGGTEVFLSYEQRPGVEELPELCARHGLVAVQVAEEDLHPSWRSPDITILRLRKRPDCA